MAAGFGSAYAVPLRLHHDGIGARTIFAPPAAALGHLSLRIGQTLADIAAIGVAHHIVLAYTATIHAQLPTALTTRVTIEQAKGVLAERGSRDMDWPSNSCAAMPAPPAYGSPISPATSSKAVSTSPPTRRTDRIQPSKRMRSPTTNWATSASDRPCAKAWARRRA